ARRRRADRAAPPPAGVHRRAARRHRPGRAPGGPAPAAPADGPGPPDGLGPGRRPVRGPAPRTLRPRPGHRPRRRGDRGQAGDARAADRPTGACPVRLGTRGSALALAQARLVAEAVTAATGERVDLVEISTAGDSSSAPVAGLGV